jgi:hypothetical protein
MEIGHLAATVLGQCQMYLMAAKKQTMDAALTYAASIPTMPAKITAYTLFMTFLKRLLRLISKLLNLEVLLLNGCTELETLPKGCVCFYRDLRGNQCIFSLKYN